MHRIGVGRHLRIDRLVMAGSAYAPSLHELAIFFGPMSGIRSMLLIVVGGTLMNQFSTSRKIDMLMRGAGCVLGAACLVVETFASCWHSALVYLTIPFMFSVVQDAPSAALMHSLVPPERRAIATALLVWVNSPGLTLGPLLVGRTSDLQQVAYGTESLERVSAVLSPFSVLAALFITGRRKWSPRPPIEFPASERITTSRIIHF